MRKTILIISIVSLLCSCTKIEEPKARAYKADNVEFAISLEEIMEVTTRAVDEYAVEDFHLFLFGTNNGEKYHFDEFQSKFNLRIEPGEYDIYAMANYAGVTADFTPEQLKALYFDFAHSSELETLPMYFKGNISVPAKGYAAVEVTLSRSVAKLSININTGNSNNRFQIISAKVVNVPTKGSLFYFSSLTTLDAENYTTRDITDELTFKDNGYGYGTYSTIFYMPENWRGDNPSILNQYSKNKANAPENATYLHLKVKWPNSGWYIYDYYVYIGQNNSTDFNIPRNSRITLGITMGYGSNVAETRVFNYFLKKDWYMGGGFSGINLYTTGFLFDHLMSVESKFEQLRVNIKYEFDPAQYKDLLIDWTPPKSSIIEGTFAPGEYKKFSLLYRPAYFHDGNRFLKYRITCTDNNGYSFFDDVVIEFANYAIINNPHINKDDGARERGGTIEFVDCLQSNGNENNKSGNYNYDYWYVFFSGEGCTLRAAPSAGYKFVGWYTSYDYTVILSNKQSYLYNPKLPQSTVYARFEPI